MSQIYVPDTMKRLWARLIDQLLSLIFYIPVVKAFFLLVFTEQEVQISVMTLIVMAFIPAIYEGVWLWILQQTPGKWFLGLKVVDAYNPEKELAWQQCLMRALVGRLDLFFSLAIYALAFFRYDRTHLADWLVETRVVQMAPRVHKAKMRWLVGSIFVVFYGWQGIEQATLFLKNAKIESGQVSLRGVYQSLSGGADLEEVEEYL